MTYKSPIVLVSTLVEAGGRVLMCRRARAPRIGYWTVPGGFVEHNESLEQAAVRETREETGISLDIGALRFYAISSLTHMNQIYVGFVVRLPHEIDPICGDECLDVRYCSEDDMPWDELAFAEFDWYLRTFFRETKRSEEHVHFFGYLDGVVYGDDSTLSRTTRTLIEHRRLPAT